MLNFENIRKVTGHMLSNSLTYAEGFVQKILDSIIFDKEHLDTCWVVYPNHFKMPDMDPLSVFDVLEFRVDYNCYGEIRFTFDESTEQDIPEFRLLAECLLSNGFVCKDNLEFTHPYIGRSE